jgi:histidinol-phosphatase
MGPMDTALPPVDPAVLAVLADELAFALELAATADAVTLPRFRARDLRVGRKADATEVTEADTACEAAIRAVIAARRPGHAVFGEEEGHGGDGTSAWQWVIDPIDGTTNYARGIPVWATLIALTHGGRPVVGVVSAPALQRRWWAALGQGAHTDDGPIRVSDTADLAQAHLGTPGTGAYWGDRRQGIIGLTHLTRRDRGFGDFWQHVLVAEGALDAAAEPVVEPYDLAALQPIVEEAGGRFTDLEGNPRHDGGSACSSNGRLHAAVLAELRPHHPHRDWRAATPDD